MEPLFPKAENVGKPSQGACLAYRFNVAAFPKAEEEGRRKLFCTKANFRPPASFPFIIQASMEPLFPERENRQSGLGDATPDLPEIKKGGVVGLGSITSFPIVSIGAGAGKRAGRRPAGNPRPAWLRATAAVRDY